MHERHDKMTAVDEPLPADEALLRETVALVLAAMRADAPDPATFTPSAKAIRFGVESELGLPVNALKPQREAVTRLAKGFEAQPDPAAEAEACLKHSTAALPVEPAQKDPYECA